MTRLMNIKGHRKEGMSLVEGSNSYKQSVKVQDLV